MFGVSELWATDLDLSPLRGLPTPLHAPLPLKRFLESPLTAPLPLTRFSARSAPFSAPLTRSAANEY